MSKEEKSEKQHPAAPTPAKPDLITVDAAGLEAVINARVAATMAAAMAGQVPLGEQFQQQMDRLRGRDQPPHDVRRFPCESPPSGATFLAVVDFTGRHKHGWCVTLEDYKEPAGVWKHVSDGGMYPDGEPIYSTTPTESMGSDGRVTTAMRQSRHPNHKKWMWENFYKRDLIEFTNKPFTPYILREEVQKRRAAEEAMVLPAGSDKAAE